MGMTTVIGTGNMGAALIRALRAGETPLTIWNRTRAKAESLVEPGVTLAESPGAALEAAACVVVNLTDYAAGFSFLESSRDHLNGKTVVQLTTGRPAEARRLAYWVEEHGGHYLDGAIMGFPNHVGTPQNLVVYSGRRRTFEDQRALLEQLGGVLYLSEDPGAASAFDIGCLMPVVAMVVGLLQGMKACEREGIVAEDYDGFVRQMVPLVLEDTLGKVRREGFADDPTRAECSVGLMAALTPLFADYARDLQIDPSLFDALAKLFQGGVAAGYGHHDWVNAAELRVVE